MNSLTIDEESFKSCTTHIKSDIKSSTSFSIFRYHYNYKTVVTFFVPSVLADVIVEYVHDIFDVKCTTLTVDTRPYYIYVDNDELQLHYIMSAYIINDCITIDTVHMFNDEYIKVYNTKCEHLCFINYVNYYEKKPLLKHECDLQINEYTISKNIAQHAINPYYNSEYSKYITSCKFVMSRVDNEVLSFRIMLLTKIYNALHKQKIDKIINLLNKIK